MHLMVPWSDLCALYFTVAVQGASVMKSLRFSVINVIAGTIAKIVCKKEIQKTQWYMQQLVVFLLK